MDFTDFELEILESALTNLDPSDLNIDAKYDHSDYISVQMSRRTSYEEMYKEMAIIQEELNRVDKEKYKILIPLMEKLGINTEQYKEYA